MTLLLIQSSMPLILPYWRPNSKVSPQISDQKHPYILTLFMVQTETAGRLTAQGPGKTFSTPNVQIRL